ncbi:MFS transporter [Ruania halotolerans]|uniref:MFS transporter n=1 Tax=Ruania halotolerans TaxID=2897773 RepID=UPI001E55D916|nr:MFS transporter [Ruania halotolerans]UFU05349.1 MFS transporter [Ruania halotolerans]
MESSTTVSDVSTPAPLKTPSPLTLPVVLTGVGLVAMSISGTAIALPSIGRDLDASGSPLNWVVAGYNLAFAAMTLVAGAAADRAGRRRIFIAAAVVFSVGFLATALAPTILVVDIARIVSGAGGAGMMAAGGALLASNYDGAARNRAFAFMGTMAGVGIAVGPTLVGGLISLAGWRGSFVVFAVLGVVIVLGSGRLAESRASESRTDWIGSILFVITLSCLMFVFLEAPALGWTHSAVLLALTLGAVGLIAFAMTQRRSEAPVLAPELIHHRGFMGWCLGTLTTSIGFLGVLVFLPTYLQTAAHLTPASAGLAMLLLTAPVLFAPVLAGGLVNRGVDARWVMMVALALVVAGNFGLLALGPDNTTALIAAPLVMIGIGMGASFGITDGQAMSLVPTRLVGTAAGFLNTLRGAAEALVIAAFSAALLGFLTHRLGDVDHAAAVSAGRLSFVDGVEIDALTTSWHLTQMGVGGICFLLSTAVAALLFSGSPRTRREEGGNP